jgi:hypothetical protein
MFHGVPRVIIIMAKNLMIEINPINFEFKKQKNNFKMTLVQLQVVQFFSMYHTLISYIVVTRRVTHKVQLHLDWYVWMNMYINIIYICCICSVACN